MEVASSTFLYATYSGYVQKLTGFGIENCFSLRSLGWKFFNDERHIGTGEERINKTFIKWV